jgi:phenylpropionate dioxygenase-like ring-hydroxylating dioxygenase large terminal subunit
MKFIILFVLVNITRSYNVGWVPFIPVSTHDFTNPSNIKVLNKEYVIWKKGGKVIVKDDMCPHRLAPLSEGYIDRRSKNLRCAYHGWEFNELGCVSCVPQIKEQKKRVKSYSYPTIIYGDILWCWLNRTIEPDLSILEKEINKEETTYMRDLPYDYYTLLENFFDPAHIPFAHHKLQSRRDAASPIEINVTKYEEDHLQFAFTDKTVIEDNEYKKRNSTMNLIPPYHYYLEDKNNRIFERLHVFCIPIERYNSRIIIKLDLKKGSMFKKIYTKVPVWIRHILMNRFIDSDTVLLCKQEENMIKNNISIEEPLNNYTLLTESDRSVIIYRRWINKYLKKEKVYLKESNKEYKEKDRKEILDRYKQHTKNCKSCKEAMKNTRILKYTMTFIPLYIAVHMSNVNMFLLSSIIYWGMTIVENKFNYVDYVHNEID